MPMELMMVISQQNLPLTIDDPADIDKLRVLAAAGLAKAQLPDINSTEQRAQVISITPEGKYALQKSQQTRSNSRLKVAGFS